MNNKGSKAAHKENKNSSENKLKDMEICNMNDREFKSAVLKNLSKMQENTDSKFNELRRQMNKTSTLPKRLKL